jgi:hypothetical protein
MAAGDAGTEASRRGLSPPRPGEGRVRHPLSGWRQLARIAYRDPAHVAERLTLYGAEHLGEPSLDWANRVRGARPDVPRAVIAEELRTQSAQVARIDGAVTGTPFLIAMAWGCETHTRELGRRALLFYDGGLSAGIGIPLFIGFGIAGIATPIFLARRASATRT